MRLDRKLLAALLTACLLLSLLPSALAADLSEMRFGGIATHGYSRTLVFYGNAVPAEDTDGNWGLIDRTGTPVTPFRYSYIQGLDKDHNLFCAHTDNAAVILDDRGNVVVPEGNYSLGAVFPTAGFLLSGSADGERTRSFYHWDGSPAALPGFLADFSYMYYSAGNGGYYTVIRSVQVDGKWNTRLGILNRDMELIVPLEYSRVDGIDGSGTFLATMPSENGGYSVLYSGDGTVLKRFQQAAYRWEDDLIDFYENDLRGIADGSGNTLLQPGSYSYVGERNPQGCIAVRAETGVGVLSQVWQDGRMILETADVLLDTSAEISGILTSSEKNGPVGLWDLNGKQILPERFQSIRSDDNGNLMVRSTSTVMGGANGVYTPQGVPLLEPIYTDVECLADGYYLVEDSESCNITNGRDFLPQYSTDAYVLSPKVVMLSDGQRGWLVDNTGELLISPCEKLQRAYIPIFGTSPYYTEYEKLTYGASSAVPFWCTENGATRTIYVDLDTGTVVRTLEGRNGPVNTDGLFVQYEGDEFGYYASGPCRLGSLGETRYVSTCSAAVSAGQVQVTANLSQSVDSEQLLAGLYADDGRFLEAAYMTVDGNTATASLPNDPNADHVQVFVTSGEDRVPLEEAAQADLGN